MKRKTVRYIPWLLLVCLISACGGTAKKATESQVILQAGVKELQKGNQLYSRGCYQQAAKYFYRAHAEFTAADDLPGIAISLNSLGNVYQANGDADNAVAFFDEALTISDALGDQKAVLQTLANKAAALIGAGHLDAAEALIETGANQATEPFLPLLVNKGILLIKKGAYPQAHTVLEEALAETPEGDRAVRAKIHFALGRLMRLQGDTRGAVEQFQRALADDRAVGFHKGMAQAHDQLGDAYREQNAPERALAHYKRSVTIYALLGERPDVKAVMEKLEKAASATGADIRLTTHFVKTWIEDKNLEGPCQ